MADLIKNCTFDKKNLQQKQSQQFRLLWLGLVTLSAIVFVFRLPIIPQDPHYHFFAGDQTLWGIANCINVLTNLPFLIAGLLGLWRIHHWERSSQKLRWQIFFIAILAVSFGSAYYHLIPNTMTLFWDRLPMTLGFAALTANFFSERFPKLNSWAFFLTLIGISIFGIFYWLYTESLGRGDLRPYLLIQFFPVLLIPLTLLLFPSRAEIDRAYWILFIGYSLAKMCEMTDFQIYFFTDQAISGHVLKHLIAGLSLCFFKPSQTGLASRN